MDPESSSSSDSPGFVIEGQIVLILCGLIGSGKVGKLLPLLWKGPKFGDTHLIFLWIISNLPFPSVNVRRSTAAALCTVSKVQSGRSRRQAPGRTFSAGDAVRRAIGVH